MCIYLAEYISDCHRRAQLAEAVGCSPDYLWQVATGWRGKRASPDLAKKIEVATSGAVTRASLRPDIWDEPCTDARLRKEAA